MIRVSSKKILHENCAKIAQRFAYVSSKNCTKFRCFCALMHELHGNNSQNCMQYLEIYSSIAFSACRFFRAAGAAAVVEAVDAAAVAAEVVARVVATVVVIPIL